MQLLLDGQETERLLFRKVLKSDFDTWLPFHQDPRTSRFWNGLPKNPKIACQKQLDSTFERNENGLGGMNALILKTTGNLIGLCGLSVLTVDGIQELEIGYSLLPDHWGMGYASEAATNCKQHAIMKNLAASLISIIQVHNLPSQKVALNIGMYFDRTTIYNNNRVNIYRVQL